MRRQRVARPPASRVPHGRSRPGGQRSWSGWVAPLALLIVALAVRPLPAAQAPAAADAQRLVAQRCTKCHGVESFASKAHSRLAWHLVILRMQAFHGARLEPGDREILVEHLTAARPAPWWRAGLDWTLLLAVPASVAVWVRRRRRRQR